MQRARLQLWEEAVGCETSQSGKCYEVHEHPLGPSYLKKLLFPAKVWKPLPNFLLGGLYQDPRILKCQRYAAFELGLGGFG